MSLALDRKLSLLADRANMLRQVRSFFAERSVLEIDCPALVRAPNIDSNIEVMTVEVSDGTTGYLHTSPEYALKRLLARGLGDIYSLGHVFRKGEIGRIHSPEFTMIEWYRIGVEFEAFIEETCDLIRLFIGHLPSRRLSYRDAFLEFAGLDPYEPSIDFPKVAQRLNIIVEPADWDRETWLALILSQAVEPQLGRGELTILLDYPSSLAALARVVEKNGFRVAERFEIYHAGVELTNGYHELANSNELRGRFEENNRQRKLQKQKPYPLDEKFLTALDHLPDCCGVSVGFDRLMLLRHRCDSMNEVLPIAWEDL